MIESEFPRHLVRVAIEAALAEDLGLAGDITGNAVIAPTETMAAAIVARSEGVIAGLPLARAAFIAIDAGLAIEPIRFDGEMVRPGDVVLQVAGNSRSILAAERVALNYLCHLSGIATATSRYVACIDGTGAAICCTRKTLPGLRAFQKYAVKAGGGQNHRFGLDDAVLVKDNHIASAGGVPAVLQRVREHAGHMVKVEIEVDTLDQLREVLQHKVDAVLLDNMSLDDMKLAVGMVAGRCVVEASGGVTLERVRDIALTGVDLISVGALTHSASVLDLGLDIA
jgi:nicotinate-nucleotide pyrophosphorylase (carboxylating)